MRSLRIVFMGTPDFSVPSLRVLQESHHKVVGVFTQPDKPKGRGKQIQKTPVKELALTYDIPVFQPSTLKSDDVREIFRNLQPDLIVVIAYGKILPSWLLALPTYGCVNIHASILPAYRGAAPIHWAILNGDKETGVTFMLMNEGMDTGDMIHVEKIPIENETTGELFEKLAILGADKLIETLDLFVDGQLLPIPQDESLATYAGKIDKSMGYINWDREPEVISRFLRGLAPAPGCVTLLDGKRIKIWRGIPYHMKHNAEPGTILEINQEFISVAAKGGVLHITEVQPENKKRMTVAEFLMGHKLTIGNKFDGFESYV